jgi:hypothetical protein
VQQRYWHRLPPIDQQDQPPPVEAPSDIVPLVEGWKMTTATADSHDWTQVDYPAAGKWKTVKLGSFAAMGLAEDAVAQFRKEIVLPKEWRAERVQLVFDADIQTQWGFFPKGWFWINGRPAAIKQPIVCQPDGSFALDVTDRVRDGRLLLTVEVDGRMAPEEPRFRPSGVTGAFYLQAEPAPVATTALPPWRLAKEVNEFVDQAKGKRPLYRYLETRFELPTQWPARRVFLELPAFRGYIVLDNRVVEPQLSMRKLDVSGLVVRKGENVLRWVPVGRPDKLPELKLQWLP